MSIKPHNKTEACFLKLRKVLKPYKVDSREDSISGTEIFDLKNGIIIAREDDIICNKIYTITKDLKLANKEEARIILKQITGIEPPKKLFCKYSTSVRVDANSDESELVYDDIPWEEKIITSKRGYSDIFREYEGQPDKKQVEKSLDKFEDHFGLKLPYKRRAVKVPKVTITL